MLEVKNMKRVLSFALSLVMLLSITGGLGLTAYAGDTYYETEDNDNYSSADYVPVNSTITVCVLMAMMKIGTSLHCLLLRR